MHRPGRERSWREFIKQLATSYKRDRVPVEAAALTYYGVLALFPFLVFLVTFGGLLLNPDRIAQLVDRIGRAAPGAVADIVGGRLRQLHEQAGGGILAVAILGALWAASSGAVSLAGSLNHIYGVDESRPFWKVRLTALAVTIGASIVALLAAAAMFVVPALGRYLGGGPAYAVLNVARFVVAGLLMMLFLGIVYRFLPDLRGRFEIFSFGALAAVPLWLVASWAFAFYCSHFAKYGAVYGALAGIIILLVWMWISSEVVLLGAEMNKVLTPPEELERQTSRRVPDRAREPFMPAPRHPEPA